LAELIIFSDNQICRRQILQNLAINFVDKKNANLTQNLI